MQMTMKEMAEWLKSGGEIPEWFTEGKQTPKGHTRNVRRGLHPFGLKLTDVEGATCGNCKHCQARDYNAGHYLKCDMVEETRGPGTDIRAKWRGCRWWEAKE